MTFSFILHETLSILLHMYLDSTSLGTLGSALINGDGEKLMSVCEAQI